MWAHFTFEVNIPEAEMDTQKIQHVVLGKYAEHSEMEVFEVISLIILP